MNKVQRNAVAYLRLLDIEYIFYLGYKGKAKKVILRFEKKHFHHLEGIGHLYDLVTHKEPAEKILKMALEGNLEEDDLKISIEYTKSFVDRKMEYLYILEDFIDNNEIVFNYIKHKIKGSSIQAKIFLYKDMREQEIYLFLDSTNDDEYYYPRSFVVSPDVDYKTGQFKYTVLWKEKRNRKTGESQVLYRFKEFEPEKLSA